MEQYRYLSSHGNHRPFLGIFSSSLRKLPSPSPQITVFSKRPQNVMRSLHHHRSQIPVSCFADFLLRLALPGVPPARFQSQKTTYLATLQKPVWIFYRQHLRQRHLRPYTLHLLEQGRFRVHFLGDFLHALVVFLDALVQRFDFIEQRLQNIPQLGAQCSGQLPAHLLRATLGQSFTVRLHQPACCVHQGRSNTPSSARARITVRWICACTLRCRTGPNSSGSIRASRANVRASCRSSFRLLLVINCTFCACATSTSCSSSVNSRLAHGECVPVSRAMRLCGILENVSFIASGVVGTFCSRMILPASSKTQ